MILVRLNQNGDIIGYPFNLGLLRLHHPELPKYGLPSEETLATYNCFTIEGVEQPAYDILYEKLEEDLPILVNNIWKQRWKIRAATTDEIEETKEQIKSEITQKTQERLDKFAQSLGYDNIISACTYKDSTLLKFQTEGQYCAIKRDLTWQKIVQIYDEVIANQREIPRSFENILLELPTLDIVEI